MSIVKKATYKFSRTVKTYFWRFLLRNKNFSIISNNCVGGMVTHDLGEPLNTPMVNLWMPAHEYVDFLSNLKENLKGEIIEIKQEEHPYPVGLLNGKYHLFFQHYDTFDTAVKTWRRRVERINYDNLFIVMCERDGCTYDDLLEFEKLSYKNKIAFVHRNYEGLKHAFVFSMYENDKELGLITNDRGLFGSRIYDKFNWVKFLNGN